MKYFLALDKGKNFKNNDRFIKIPLNSINDKMSQDNNLQILCTFTTTFENESKLKSFLIAKKLLDVRKANYSLVILYFRDFNRQIEVPYKSMIPFLDFHYLEKVIIKNAKTPNFLKIIINQYHNYKNLTQELYSLESFLSNPYADYKLYDVVRKLVSKICFIKGYNKERLSYKSLLGLATLIKKMIDLNNPKNTYQKPTTENIQNTFYDEDDPRLHHLEELEERAKIDSNNQMRLF